MMIATYKRKLYRIIKDGKHWELVSKKPQSVLDGFVKDGNLFYKTLSDLSVLEDIYDIWMTVEYDTHFDKVPKQWRLEFTNEFISSDKVKLLYGEGILPKWNIEDKNICSKYVNISEIKESYVIRKSVINGKEEKRCINPSNIEEIFKRVLTM